MNLTQETLREKTRNMNLSDYGPVTSLALASAESFAKIVRFSLETGSFFLQFLGKNQSYLIIRSVCY